MNIEFSYAEESSWCSWNVSLTELAGKRVVVVVVVVVVSVIIQK